MTGKLGDDQRAEAGRTGRERAFSRDMERGAVTLKRELGYNPTRWMQMVHEHGAVEAARRILRGSDYSDGFAKLWEAGRLDMTVEWFVLVYHNLFSDEERLIAYRRLRQYEVPVDDWLRDRLDRRHP